MAITCLPTTNRFQPTILSSRLNYSHPLARGLVGYWLLNENGGLRANDLSGYNNHGTLTNYNDTDSVALDNPGTGTDGGGTGSAWTLPGNITASDDVYATSAIAGNVNSGAYSKYLNATNYAPAIPANARIVGIQVDVHCLRSGTINGSEVYITAIQLMVNGSRTGSDYGNDITPVDFTETTHSFGGATDTWGLNLTGADVTASNFGVSCRFKNMEIGGVTVSVDVIQMTFYYTSPTWVPSAKGIALNFDMTDTFVNCGSNPILDNLAAGAFSVAAWIYPRSNGENTTSGGRILEKRATEGWALYQNDTVANQCLVLYIETTGASDCRRYSATNTFAYPNWYFVVVTFAGDVAVASGIKIYVNGKETTYASTGNGAGSASSDATGNLIIGNNAAAGNTFDGYIQNAMVWRNRVLTPSEVRELYVNPYCLIQYRPRRFYPTTAVTPSGLGIMTTRTRWWGDL